MGTSTNEDLYGIDVPFEITRTVKPNPAIDHIDIKPEGNTVEPERRIARAARGDYFEGWTGDTPDSEIFEGVSVSDRHEEIASQVLSYGYDRNPSLLARVAAMIDHLMRSGHWGPFEHAQLSYTVTGITRVTMAQITRHRHFTFDVQSQRYVDFSTKPAGELVTTPKSYVDRDHFSREGLSGLTADELDELRTQYEESVLDSIETYRDHVDAGIPPEDARFVLPEGSRVNMTVSGNIRAWLHVFNMRRKGDAQWEIRALTDLLYEAFCEEVPIVAYYFDSHGPYTESP